MEYPLVSVVLLCWNRREDVEEVMEHLARVEYPRLEIVVVDNASEDGTAEMVATRFPRVRLLRMAENLGIAGYNAGFEVARGEYLVILDDDSYPAPDAVGRMVGRFEIDPLLGVIAFDVRNAAGFRWQPGAIVPEASGTATAYQMSFNGAGFGIRRALFEQIGWYPAEFFLYWNEQDTAFRVLDAGYRIETRDDIVALHKFSPRNRASERAPFFYTRNAFWMVWKNYPFDLALLTTARLIYLCCYHALEQRSGVYLRAMWKAFKDGEALRGKRKPVAREIISASRVAFENTFAQFR